MLNDLVLIYYLKLEVVQNIIKINAHKKLKEKNILNYVTIISQFKEQ